MPVKRIVMVHHGIYLSGARMVLVRGDNSTRTITHRPTVDAIIRTVTTRVQQGNGGLLPFSNGWSWYNWTP